MERMICIQERLTCLKTYCISFGLSFALASFFAWFTDHRLVPAIATVFPLAGVWVYRVLWTQVALSPDQFVIITGCDSGLGYSLALHCQSLGITVVASVLQKHGRAAEELKQHGIVVLPLDITDQESTKNFGTAIRGLMRERKLVLRALVNNAGVMIFGEYEWQTEEQARYQVDVNVLGTMRITKELMPIVRAGSSRIIIVTSHCASEALPGVSVYSATKAAIAAWATALRVELKKYGVDVVCFVPGSFTCESNIMARQVEHFASMDASMLKETREYYGEYFKRYAEYFRPMSRENTMVRLKNARVYEIFQQALLDKYPSAVYKCEPWRYFFYYTSFKIMPTYVRDRLVEKFVHVPSWKLDDRKSADDKANDQMGTTETRANLNIILEDMPTISQDHGKGILDKDKNKCKIAGNCTL